MLSIEKKKQKKIKSKTKKQKHKQTKNIEFAKVALLLNYIQRFRPCFHYF